MGLLLGRVQWQNKFSTGLWPRNPPCL